MGPSLAINFFHIKMGPSLAIICSTLKVYHFCNDAQSGDLTVLVDIWGQTARMSGGSWVHHPQHHVVAPISWSVLAQYIAHPVLGSPEQHRNTPINCHYKTINNISIIGITASYWTKYHYSFIPFAFDNYTSPGSHSQIVVPVHFLCILDALLVTSRCVSEPR